MMLSKLCPRLLCSRQFKLLANRGISISSIRYQQTLKELDVPTYADTLNNAPKVDIGLLENGVQIISQDSGSDFCTIGVYLEAGSRFELVENNGAAYFADRLWFKGTENRTEAQIESEVEALGATMDSFVRRDEAGIVARCHSKDASKVIDLLGDIVLKPAWDDTQVEQVRSQVLDELIELESEPKQMVMDYLHATAYQGTPLAFSIYGSEANVEQMSSADVKRFYEDQIKAPRTIVSVVGGVDHKNVLEAGTRNFGDMTISYENEIPLYDQFTRFTGSELRHRHDDYPLCVGAVAVEAPPVNSPDNIELQIAAHIIGSWDKTHVSSHNLASRLASFVVNAAVDDGTCHSFEHFLLNYRETGLWGAYFVMDNMQPLEFVPRLQSEWMRLCTSITEAEVERAKNFMRTDLFSKLSNPRLAAHMHARQLHMLDRIIPPAEMETRINQVTAKRIHNVCMRYIYDTCPAVANYGRVEAFPDYVNVRSYMWQFRI